MTGRRRLPALTLTLVMLAAPAAAAAPCPATKWVGAWHASPSDQVSRDFVGQTLRLVITPHYGGTRARVRLSNRFGLAPVTFSRAAVAQREAGASIVEGSARPLSFGGSESVTIPPGGDVISDPVALAVRPFEDLVVDLYAADLSGPATQHFGARQTSFVGAGDHVGERDGGAFGETITSWPFLSGVDVQAPGDVGAVVTFGDSITDGFQGQITPVTENPEGIDANVRYPDVLARRLLAAGRRLSVLNAGISGNRTSQGGMIPQFGPAGLARLSNDVIAQPGVTDVIVLEGINDIGQVPAATARDVIAALGQIVARLQAAGLRVHLGTLTPAGGTLVDSYGGAAADATRQEVNAWIRTQDIADSVVDFDAALRDPQDPSRLLGRYDSSDHLHPSSEGYAAMAAAVDLDALRGTGCRAARPRLRIRTLRAAPGFVRIRVSATVPLRHVVVRLRRTGAAARAPRGGTLRLRAPRPGAYRLVVRARTAGGVRLIARRRVEVA